MKKNLPAFLIACLFGCNAYSQNVPNGGFENWTNMGSYEDLDQWLTLNPFFTVGYPLTATKSTPAPSGNFALKLEVKSFMNPQTNMLDTMPGLVMSQNSGFPYALRPATMNANVKFSTPGIDTAEIYVQLARWNASLPGRELIGDAYFFVFTNLPVYTPISIPITYYNSANPDTCLVMITCGFTTPVPNSAFYIDNLSLNGASGIAEHSYEHTLSLYPVPASDRITIKTDVFPYTAFVYSLSGELLLEQKPGTDGSLALDGLAPSLYFLEVRDAKGIVAGRKLFSIAR